MARVLLEGVSKVFPGRVTAVEHLHLEVEDGEFMVLVGPSGCGKSTTLRMIAGLEEISEGSVYIGDRRVDDIAPKERNISMVFQNFALYPHMSVYKNMAFGLQLRYGGGVLARSFRRLFQSAKANELAVKRRGIKQEVLQAAKMLGIEHLLDRMPGQLSGGERQRVALGRAIVRKPAAFLFDEPLSNLDAKLRVEMRRELKRLHEQLGTTMIYVTHDQVEALTLGQRVAVMDQGKLQQTGAPMDVYDRPRNRFVASFIGTPPMNFLEGELRESDGQWRFVGGNVTAALPPHKFSKLTDRQSGGGRVALGIRPEHVAIEMETSGASSSREVVNRARVRVVESLGDSTVVHLEVVGGEGREESAEQYMVCKTGSRVALKPAAVVYVNLDTAQAHLFDIETGASLL